MAYRIAAIDVHKKMLAVVIADVAGEGEFQFERRKFGATASELDLLAQWFIQHEVEEVVMEWFPVYRLEFATQTSTAQYWKPVWGALERHWRPNRQARAGSSAKCGTWHLCQAKSNRGARGRKSDYVDAERMTKRLVAGELVLSFVPDPDQRLLRTVTRRKYQLTRAKAAFRNQLESLLEQAHIKLSSFVSDLLGVSALRMIKALANGETDPAILAKLADRRLQATTDELRDALGACAQMNPVYRRLLKMALAELALLDTHIEELEREAMGLTRPDQDAVKRVAEIPGFGADSALQIIAEVGAHAAAFRSEKALCSWVGVCPGNEESAGESRSTRSPKGNHYARRILNQAAHAAVKVKGSVFEVTFKRLFPRLGYKQAIWAIAHRLCRLIWLILHKGVSYEERGPAVSANSKRVRTNRMIRELRKLGYHIEGGPAHLPNPA